MADELYAARDGRQIGLFSRDKLDVFLSSGQLEPSDFLWQEGWAQWTSVAAFLEQSSAQRIAAKFSVARARTSRRHWGAIRIPVAIIGFIGALGAALLLTLYPR
jgi:hypothetical protein